MQVALAPDGAAVVGWVEFANEKSTFKVRRIDAAGVRGQSVAVPRCPARDSRDWPSQRTRQFSRGRKAKRTPRV